MKALLLVIVFVISTKYGLCHSDYIYSNKINNVTVQITTGFKYEEISKSFMLGYYANKLTLFYSYRKDIVINYRHAYTKNIIPSYYLSFGKGEYNATGGVCSNSKGVKSIANMQGKLLDAQGLVINIYSSKLDFYEVLNLIEYGIENEKEIKLNQKEIYTNANYTYWQYSFKSIDTIAIKNIVLKKSKAISKILSEPCYRFDDFTKKYKKQMNPRNGVSYFFKDSLFYIRGVRFQSSDSVSLTLSNIVFYKQLDYESAIVFDTDSSFYYTGWTPHERTIISNRQIIRNRNPKYNPIEVYKVSGDKIFMTFWQNYHIEKRYENGGSLSLDSSRERTIFYNPKTDLLIQDVDSVLIKTTANKYPILKWLRPFFRNVSGGQVYQLQKGHIIREDTFCFGDFPDYT